MRAEQTKPIIFHLLEEGESGTEPYAASAEVTDVSIRKSEESENYIFPNEVDGGLIKVSNVHSDFNIARNNQADLIVNNKRILITDKHPSLGVYYGVLAAAGQRALQLTSQVPFSSNSDLATFEIPRDARTLQQVAMSTESANAPRSSVFRKFGQSLQDIKAKTGLIPKIEDIELGAVLYSRTDDEIIFAPPLNFEPFSSVKQAVLASKLERDINTTYKNFGSSALLAAFHKGVE